MPNDELKTTIAVPAEWLSATVELLNEMAGAGIGMIDCADPADLMMQIAEYLGVADEDDCWCAAVREIANAR